MIIDQPKEEPISHTGYQRRSRYPNRDIAVIRLDIFKVRLPRCRIKESHCLGVSRRFIRVTGEIHVHKVMPSRVSDDATNTCPMTVVCAYSTKGGGVRRIFTPGFSRNSCGHPCQNRRCRYYLW